MEGSTKKLSEPIRRAMQKHYQATESFAYWSENCFRILPRHGRRRYVPFVHNKIQRSVGAKIQASGKRHVVAVMPRRTGKSSFFSSRGVHIATREPNKFILMTSYDQDQIRKAALRLKLCAKASPTVTQIDGIDIPIMPKLMDTGKDEIVFCFDSSNPDPLEFSRIDTDTAGAGDSVGRGEDYDMILLMEAGQPQYHSYRTYQAAYQCMPVGTGLFVMEGTPFGALGPMFDKFTESDSDPASSEFVAIFETWTDYEEYKIALLPGEDPAKWEKGIRYDTNIIEPENNFEFELIHTYGVTLEQLKWARYQVKTGFGKNASMDPYETFHQEYPIDKEKCWIVQGSAVLSVEMMQAGLKRAMTAMTEKVDPLTGRAFKEQRYRAIYGADGKPRLEKDSVGPWRFIEAPERDAAGNLTGAYCMSADVAEGVDGDYTVIYVTKKTNRGPNRVVAQCRIRDPHTWGIAQQMAIVGRMYNVAWLMPEANNRMGGTLVAALMNGTDYPHHKIFVMPGEAEASYSGYKKKIGWLTTSKTKPIMVGELQDALFINYKNPASDDGLECFYPEFWWEAKTFTKQGGVGMRASRGNTDDCVISLSINNWGLRHWLPSVNTVEIRPQIFVPGQRVPYSKINDAFNRDPDLVERYA